MSAAGRERLPDAPSAGTDPSPRRLCDHCGRAVGTLNPWDRPGRLDGFWLHPHCEGAWYESEGRCL
jgi:hypothetical protein